LDFTDTTDRATDDRHHPRSFFKALILLRYACRVSRGPTYAERAPRPALRDRLACVWTARFADDGTPHVDRVIPDGCIDLLWTAGRLIVAGPDTTATPVAPRPGAEILGVRFLPGAAPPLLGVPASALRDARLDARELLGDRAAVLADALSNTAEHARTLEAHLERWRAAPRDPLVAHAASALAGGAAVRALAAASGVSERQLLRRFDAAIGYGPKTFARIARLRRFVSLASHARRALAELALAAGYADQAHLTRECRALAGCTPAALAGYPVTAA
jgi:AraC-like DNA-binding protein